MFGAILATVSSMLVTMTGRVSTQQRSYVMKSFISNTLVAAALIIGSLGLFCAMANLQQATAQNIQTIIVGLHAGGN
jgi:hypothetical protein